jgi:hypothetical protein
VRVPDGALLSILSSAGVAGVFCVFYVTGLVPTRGEVRLAEKDAGNWKAAYEAERTARETERRANDELRAANIVQAQRADAAVETAKLARELLEDLRRRTHEAAT